MLSKRVLEGHLVPIILRKHLFIFFTRKIVILRFLRLFTSNFLIKKKIKIIGTR